MRATIIPAVELLEVHDGIHVVGADFVVFEKCGRGIGGDVDLADGVEEVCLLDATRGAQLRQESFHRGELGKEFDDDFARGFEDGVVEDAGLVVADASIPVAVIGEFVLDALPDFAESVVFVFVAQTVSLVDEDFEVDAWVMFGHEHGRSEKFVDAVQVFILTIDDPDNSTSAAEDSGVVEVGCEDW